MVFFTVFCYIDVLYIFYFLYMLISMFFYYFFLHIQTLYDALSLCFPVINFLLLLLLF